MTDHEDQLPPGGTRIGPDPPWDAWTPDHVTRLLAGVSEPWCVAAGWALDLFLGAQTRAHGDLEIAVPAGGFWAVRDALADYDLEVVDFGRSWPLDSPVFGNSVQTWVRDADAGVYRLDIFREPHDGSTWICRRDKSIRLPYEQIIRRTESGIPYLAPQIALLFEAKHVRPKDEADLTVVLPLLEEPDRDWLVWAVRRVHPDHAWIGRAAHASGANAGGAGAGGAEAGGAEVGRADAGGADIGGADGD